MFNRSPIGRYHVMVCGTTPCMLCGARRISAAIKQHLGIDYGQTTSVRASLVSPALQIMLLKCGENDLNDQDGTLDMEHAVRCAPGRWHEGCVVDWVRRITSGSVAGLNFCVHAQVLSACSSAEGRLFVCGHLIRTGCSSQARRGLNGQPA